MMCPVSSLVSKRISSPRSERSSISSTGCSCGKPWPYILLIFFFSSRRRHTRWTGDWSSDVCSSDLPGEEPARLRHRQERQRPRGDRVDRGGEIERRLRAAGRADDLPRRHAAIHPHGRLPLHRSRARPAGAHPDRRARPADPHPDRRRYSLKLMPFFSFYGGKWRAAPKYPAPLYDTIIEPFAGSAGYAVRHYEKRVLLCEKDPVIAALW